MRPTLTAWFDFIACANAFIDAALAAAAVLSTRRNANPVNSFTLIGATAIASVSWCLKAAALHFLGVGIFGLLNLIYCAGAITAPLVGLAVLISPILTQRRVTPLANCVGALVCLGAPVGLYATFYEPFNLKLETATVTLAATRAGSAPIKIAVLADIQTENVTDYERNAVDRIMAKTPDIVLIPGDIFQGTDALFDRQFDALVDLLNRITVPAYMVDGDTDTIERLRRLEAETNVRLLDNQSVQTGIADRTVTIAGVDRHGSIMARRIIQALESDPDERDIRILVSHAPDIAMNLEPDSRIDLVVVGHTHGGQVVIPFYGPPITFSRMPRNICAGDLHEFNGVQLYVSRGVGWEQAKAPRIRFLCPPEISLLTLR
jgi:hypothetical protein